MSQNLLFVGWNDARPGREQASNEVFGQFLGYLGKQQEAGNITGFEPVILERHGGDLNGFVMIRGEGNKLAQMRQSKDFVNLMMQGSHTVAGMGVLGGWASDAAMGLMQDWQKIITK